MGERDRQRGISHFSPCNPPRLLPLSIWRSIYSPFRSPSLCPSILSLARVCPHGALRSAFLQLASCGVRGRHRQSVTDCRVGANVRPCSGLMKTRSLQSGATSPQPVDVETHFLAGDASQSRQLQSIKHRIVLKSRAAARTRAVLTAVWRAGQCNRNSLIVLMEAYSGERRKLGTITDFFAVLFGSCILRICLRRGSEGGNVKSLSWDNACRESQTLVGTRDDVLWWLKHSFSCGGAFFLPIVLRLS